MNRHRHNHRPAGGGFDYGQLLATVRPEVAARTAAAKSARATVEATVVAARLGSLPTAPSREAGQPEKGESARSGDASDEFGDLA